MAKATYKVRESSAKFDQLFTTTTDKWAPKVINQWVIKYPHFAWMLSRKRTDRIDSGNQFVIPMEVE